MASADGGGRRSSRPSTCTTARLLRVRSSARPPQQIARSPSLASNSQRQRLPIPPPSSPRRFIHRIACRDRIPYPLCQGRHLALQHVAARQLGQCSSQHLQPPPTPQAHHLHGLIWQAAGFPQARHGTHTIQLRHEQRIMVGTNEKRRDKERSASAARRRHRRCRPCRLLRPRQRAQTSQPPARCRCGWP